MHRQTSARENPNMRVLRASAGCVASKDTEDRSAPSPRGVSPQRMCHMSISLSGDVASRAICQRSAHSRLQETVGGWELGASSASTIEAPLKLNCCCTDAGVVQVEGMIDGRPCHLRNDTGAERTFPKKSNIVLQDLPLASSRMYGVTGHCVPLRGPREMLIGVGSLEYKPSVYVADVEDLCILGLDFLVQNQTCIDFKKEALLVGGIEVPLVKEKFMVKKVCAQISRIKVPEHLDLQRSIQCLTEE